MKNRSPVGAPCGHGPRGRPPGLRRTGDSTVTETVLDPGEVQHRFSQEIRTHPDWSAWCWDKQVEIYWRPDRQDVKNALEDDLHKWSTYILDCHRPPSNAHEVAMNVVVGAMCDTLHELLESTTVEGVGLAMTHATENSREQEAYEFIYRRLERVLKDYAKRFPLEGLAVPPVPDE